MVPVIAESLTAIVALVVGCVCVRELIVSGCRWDLLLLAVFSLATVPLLLRRAFQIIREVRALVEDMDH